MVHPSRAVRHCDAIERRILGCDDFLRIQHYDWAGYTHRCHSDWLGKPYLRPESKENLLTFQQKYYIVFIVCNLTNAIFFWCLQPETKGLNLEDMDELFRESPLFVPGSKWLPSSHVDEDARDFAKREREAGVLDKTQAAEYLDSV